MRYFSYVVSEDDVNITKLIYSEQEVLEEFWDFWTAEMKGNGFVDLISQENCIQDWVAYNWAVQEDVYRFKTGYQGKIFVIAEFHPLDPNFEMVKPQCVNDNSVMIDRYVNIGLELERVDV